jgi:hypothetical protein
VLKPHDSAGSWPVRERFGDLSGAEESWRLEAARRWLQIRDGPFFFFSFWLQALLAVWAPINTLSSRVAYLISAPEIDD